MMRSVDTYRKLAAAQASRRVLGVLCAPLGPYDFFGISSHMAPRSHGRTNTRLWHGVRWDRTYGFQVDGEQHRPFVDADKRHLSAFADFHIVALASNPLAVGIYPERGDHSEVPPTANSFERIFISSEPLNWQLR